MRFSGVKCWNFTKTLNIDILLYYTCIHCLLTHSANVTLKNVGKLLISHFKFVSLQL